MKDITNLKTILLTVLLVFIVNFIFGYLVFKDQLFEVTHPGFGFIILPIVGAIVFSLKMLKKNRDMIYAALIIFVLNIMITVGLNFSLIITHLFFYAAIIAAVIIFSLYFNRLKTMKVIRPLLMASMLAMVFPMASVFTWILFSAPDMNWHPFQNLPYGFVMGLGIGIGIEIKEYFINTKKILKL